MATILVTGASGFIGRAVATDLVKRNVSVVCSARGTLTIPGAEIRQISNLTGTTDWSSTLLGVSCVVHLAGRAHKFNDRASDELNAFREINLHGTLRIAEQALQSGVKRFVFVSTIGVNGGSSSRPFTAQDTPNPEGPYALSKFEAEDRLLELVGGTGMELVIVRPPLVYGPTCPGNFLRLMSLIYSGIPLPLAKINNLRSMIGIWNLSDFLVRCALDERAANKTFLIADAEVISTSELVETIALGMDRPLRLFPLPKRLVFVAGKVFRARRVVESLWENLEVNTNHARTELDWNQPVPSRTGIYLTAEWYAKSRRISAPHNR